MMSVITRFAPSPTGYLHIGSARTAIFNYLFAKHFNGKFLLRIEDTDKVRSSDEATKAIIDGLEWMGVFHDDNIVYQSERAARHAEIAYKLVNEGKAYKCFAEQAEIDLERQRAIAKGESFLFKSPWRDASEDMLPKDKLFVVRLKAPREGNTVIQDLVQGEVVVSNKILDDMVLLRGDGTPTYMLAVVVDDYDMKVTHVIRGDDHLNNAFRQKILYEAAGWKVPEMGHIPLIHGQDGAKLSKRHGAVGVEWYKDAGYLPDALFNYLLKLGWSHGDDEIISKQEAIRWFDGSHVGKSSSRIDFEKLKFINAQYLRNLEDRELLNIIMEIWHKRKIEFDLTTQSFLMKAMSEIKVRSELTEELAELALIYHKDNIYSIEEDAKLIVAAVSDELLADIYQLIDGMENFAKENIQSGFKDLSVKKGMKLGDLMSPVRAILTGKTSSPSIFHIIEIIGKDITLARLAEYKRKIL